MSANKNPIFVGTIQSGFVTVPSGAGSVNTALDGTGTLGTNIFSLFTADATNGSVVQGVNIQHLGTNVATVMRVFENNGSTNGTAANNALIAEITLAANTLSQVAAQIQTNIIDFGAAGWNLKAGYRLLVTIGTQVAAGYAVSTRNAGDMT
jgi:hypothetical protein